MTPSPCLLPVIACIAAGVDSSNPFGPVPDPAAGGGHRSRAPSGTGTYGSPAPAAAASPLPPPLPLPTPALPAAVPDPMDLGLQQLRTGMGKGVGGGVACTHKGKAGRGLRTCGSGKCPGSLQQPAATVSDSGTSRSSGGDDKTIKLCAAP